MSDDFYVVWRAHPSPGWAADPRGWAHSLALDEAQRFSREEAIRISRGDLPQAVKTGRITTVPVRLADIEAMLKAPDY
jgi:hypothetical protein